MLPDKSPLIIFVELNNNKRKENTLVISKLLRVALKC